MSVSYIEYKSKDWTVCGRVPTPQLEHPQLAQSPEQEQVEQPQGDMASMGGMKVGMCIDLLLLDGFGSRLCLCLSPVGDILLFI